MPSTSTPPRAPEGLPATQRSCCRTRRRTSTQRLADNLEIALKSRETIRIAKGILMERDGLTMEEAFDVMRVASQETNTKLNEIARRIVEKE